MRSRQKGYDMMSGVSNTQRLRNLIQAARDQHGWSYEEISKRTDRKLGKSLVHKLATEPHRDDLLPTEQLKALAKGLAVPFPEVRAAALADAGLLDVEPITDVPAAIRGDTNLLPEARRHLLNQYQLLLRVAAADEKAVPTPEDAIADIRSLPSVARKPRPAPRKRQT